MMLYLREAEQMGRSIAQFKRQKNYHAPQSFCKGKEVFQFCGKGYGADIHEPMPGKLEHHTSAMGKQPQ